MPPRRAGQLAALAGGTHDVRGRELSANRPRLLSYVGRWGRARRWLPEDVHRVLDVGSAFAYGTAALTGSGRGRRWVIGLERDADHLRVAGADFGWLPLLQADATSMPLPDGSLQAVVMLDVLEHMDSPADVLREVRRVLHPGGWLVLSVPHHGLLSAVDAFNVYPALRRRWPSFPPLEASEESASGTHRHFQAAEVQALLGSAFAVDRVARTGIGLAEMVHIGLLVVVKALLGWRRVYLGLRVLHFIVYLLEDCVPTGSLGYYLTVRARAV